MRQLINLILILTFCVSCKHLNDDKKPEIRIYIAWPGYQALPYYNWSELALEPNGPEPDLLREILKLKDYKYYFVADYTYRGEGDPRIESLTDNAADISMRAISITKERAKLVDFSDTYFIDGLAAMVKKGSDIKTPSDLDGKQIFVYSYTLAYNWVKKNLPNAIITTEIDVNINPWTLQQQGLSDVYINDKITLKSVTNLNSGFKILEGMLTKDSLGIAIRKGNPELLSDINDALEELKSNGKLNQILSKYYK